MQTLKNWKARRAGGRITINGEATAGTGKVQPYRVTNVDTIEATDKGVVATDKNQNQYLLA